MTKLPKTMGSRAIGLRVHHSDVENIESRRLKNIFQQTDVPLLYSASTTKGFKEVSRKTCMSNTVELRKRIQAEIDKHLAIVATLREKLTLVEQVENIAKELNSTDADHSYKAATATDTKPEPSSSFVSSATEQTTEQSIKEGLAATTEAVVNGSKKQYALMHEGFKSYQVGKADKALELFHEARNLNPSGFEKTWTTMISLPAYSVVTQDKYFIESLFTK